MLNAFVFMNQLFLNNSPFVTDEDEGSHVCMLRI